jgi:glycine cleavage system H protein
MSDKYPSDLVYTKDHEWARIEGPIATIGISKFAVDQLGNITLVELPKEGEAFKRGDVMGTVESVKAVSDIFAPLSGKVLKVNDPLRDSPENVNDEPYEEGWMVQLELAAPAEVKELMDLAAYQKFIEEHEAE